MKTNVKNILNHHTTNKTSFAALLVTIGIIYGDIGTSPLYTFKAIAGERMLDMTLVFGGISCIFWTLVLLTTVKYVWLTLRADNEGEGGIFALYSLVGRRSRRRLAIFTMIGAAALLADGMLTPAVSITSAIEGIAVIDGLEHIPVAPIVIAIVSAVFALQGFGTQKVGKMFGPIILLWFLTLFILGLTQIIYCPQVLLALNPLYAINLLTHYPHGFWILGAVFLCTTGAEALYSDMGHCGRKNIRITWIFVCICLVTTYLGQAAWMLRQGGTLSQRNPFYEIMPQWFVLPGVIIATCAAIIASQAMISGSFSLINEAINLNFWQRSVVRQPTETKGQIYIPSINAILWIGCIAVILYFRSSARMEAAYGLTITITMLMTTALLFYFIKIKLKWNKILTYLLLAMFLCLELSFLTANIVKFTDGGFITIIVAGAFLVVMYVSFFGRIKVNRYIRFVNLHDYIGKIKELSADRSIPKFTTHLVYLTKSDNRDRIEEKIASSIFAQTPKRADVYWFFHINRVNFPYTLKYEVEAIAEDKILRINVDVGFRVRPRVELYFKRIIEDLVSNKELNLHQRYNGSTKYNPELGFKFIIISRYLSYENEFSIIDGAILKSYFLLRKLSLSGQTQFGIDESDVIVERQPLVHQPVHDLKLERNKNH